MNTQANPPAEAIGRLTCPSGTVIVADLDYLDAWSGASLVDHAQGPEGSSDANDFQDLRITGHDADRAARLLDLQAFQFLYDVPSHAVPRLRQRFDQVRSAHRLRAELEAEPARVPHRERARRVVARGGGDFLVDGAAVVAVGGMPPTARCPVTAFADSGEEQVGSRWAQVEIRVRPPRHSRSRQVGEVCVDSGRLVLVDADALNQWRRDGSVDGLADLVYWGRDQALAQAAIGGMALADGTLGWAGIPVEQAMRLADVLKAWRGQDHSRHLAIDVRQHSHQYRVMQQLGGSERAVASFQLGDSSALAFQTTWGDGHFPVAVDEDTDGALLAVRIVFADQARSEAPEVIR